MLRWCVPQGSSVDLNLPRRPRFETVLVTGAAGFIGFHTALRLLGEGRKVVGFDNVNDYYDPNLKEARLEILARQPRFLFVRADLEDREALFACFEEHRPQAVVHLAAQAGVRYSLKNPYAYVSSNVLGFLNVLEACRGGREPVGGDAGEDSTTNSAEPSMTPARGGTPVSHLVFASSSSVYGGNTKLPFSVHDNVDHPLSLYAATKKADELMAHTYAHLYGLPCTGLRFFTVYGPWGRPDMALFRFTKAILDGTPIEVFNNGRMSRDFTYIEDIVEGVVRVLDQPAQPNAAWRGNSPDPGTSPAPYRIFNIGNDKPVELLRFIEVLERFLGKTAEKKLLPLQPGDVPETWADVSDLWECFAWRPSTPIETGIGRFVEWYRSYYQV